MWRTLCLFHGVPKSTRHARAYGAQIRFEADWTGSCEHRLCRLVKESSPGFPGASRLRPKQARGEVLSRVFKGRRGNIAKGWANSPPSRNQPNSAGFIAMTKREIGFTESLNLTVLRASAGLTGLLAFAGAPIATRTASAGALHGLLLPAISAERV
ncbi:hypothetical protein MRX96_054232 [Rhipicephalus microplus]